VNIRSCILSLLLVGTGALAQDAPRHRVAAPLQHANLTVFLIHGADEAEHSNVLTLQEAMARRILVVHETSNVNQLALENTSAEHEVFIQSGDIVKGGKQDRMLSVDLIVPPKSGSVPVEAFCVEAGRWSPRSGENASQFSSSNERIVSKDLKLAANRARSQDEVWKKVAEVQGKLSGNVRSDVAAPASRTSLQLSLEHGEVAASVDDYVKALSGAIDGQSDVIGYAFAINGRINSADIYGSHALFASLWPKLLKASATEALAETGGTGPAAKLSVADVEAFLARAEGGKVEERAVTPEVSVVTRESETDIVFETRDSRRKGAIHRSYLLKD
jgi:hypothetical protein